MGRSSRARRLRACALVVLATLLSFGIARAADPPRTIRASSELDFPPLAQVDARGEADGFTVALFRAVAAEMGLEAKIRVAPFGEIRHDLATGEADVLLNLAWSPERARTVDFSVTHTRTQGAIFARTGDAKVRDERDLPGARIGVIRGDLAHDWALSQGWGEHVVARDTADAVMRDLAGGTVDCVLMARLVGVVTLKQEALVDRIETTGEPVQGFEQRFAFAVRKGDAELLAQLNEGLALVTADGTYARLYEEWFGPVEPIEFTPQQIARVALPVSIAGLALLLWLNWRLRRTTRALKAAGAERERLIDERTRELRKSISLLEATLDSTEDGILVVDAQGRPTAFNQRFVEIWRMPEEILASEDDEIMRKWAMGQLVDPQGFLAKIDELYATPEVESFDVLHLRDGRILERYSQPQRVDRRPVGRVWSFRDVTGLHSAEQRFRELAESVPEIFWVYDPRIERVLYVSPAFERIWGRAPEAVFASRESFFACIHPDDRKSMVGVRDRQRSGADASIEYRIVRPDGEVRWLWERSFPVFNASGELVRLHGTATDITERRSDEANRIAFERNLQETQKLESLGLLAGGVAHDFNNLLTAMLGQASLARVGLPEDSPLVAPLTAIEEAALRAAELCRQMLAYAGKSTLTSDRVDLDDVVESTLPLLRASVGKRIALRFERTAGLPAVFGDAIQLRQIVMNLVLNASEALDDRDGSIEITTGCTQLDAARLRTLRLGSDLPAGRYVVLGVRDDGPGIAADVLGRIFDPFFTTRFAGRGLGLAAVLGIVRAHHGAIDVVTAPGSGAQFRVHLPALDGVASEAAAPAAALHRSVAPAAILVVDDEAAVRAVVARALELAGHEVTAVGGGREAIAAVEREPDRFALVVLDLTMPGLDGRETFERLRAIRASLPVLLMSGYDVREIAHRFPRPGPAGVLPKPFTATTLCEQVAAILLAAR